MSLQIALNDLAIGYRGRPLLSGIYLSIGAGEFWGIVGPNGSGKTTLLKTILGILKPMDGRMERSNSLSLGYVPQRGGPGRYLSLDSPGRGPDGEVSQGRPLPQGLEGRP